MTQCKLYGFKSAECLTTVSFSVNHIRRHLDLVCLITADVNIDHLVEVSASFLHCNDFFPLELISNMQDIQ